METRAYSTEGATGNQTQASCWAFAHLMMWLKRRWWNELFTGKSRIDAYQGCEDFSTKILNPNENLTSFELFQSAIVSLHHADPRTAGLPQAAVRPRELEPGGAGWWELVGEHVLDSGPSEDPFWSAEEGAAKGVCVHRLFNFTVNNNFKKKKELLGFQSLFCHKLTHLEKSSTMILVILT